VAACGVAALRLWRPSDIDLTIEGLAAAYPGSDPSRPFAPGGTRGEWREYVTGLVGTASCGTLMRSSSFVAADASGRALGIVLVTRLAAATAHVAQLVVLPEAQKRGLGRLLLEAARRHARRGGCDRMTLLVARGNARAQRLYEESGFRTITTFLSARAVL
jgi:ribosomal protein S18 acetylase RimI-like enzyme